MVRVIIVSLCLICILCRAEKSPPSHQNLFINTTYTHPPPPPPVPSPPPLPPPPVPYPRPPPPPLPSIKSTFICLFIFYLEVWVSLIIWFIYHGKRYLVIYRNMRYFDRSMENSGIFLA